jgi:hypothetical protein
MPCPPEFTARDVANEYLRWLPRLGWPALQVHVEHGRVAHFELRPVGTLLKLRFAADRSPKGRQLFFVTGGLLVKGEGKRSGTARISASAGREGRAGRHTRLFAPAAVVRVQQHTGTRPPRGDVGLSAAPGAPHGPAVRNGLRLVCPPRALLVGRVRSALFHEPCPARSGRAAFPRNVYLCRRAVY